MTVCGGSVQEGKASCFFFVVETRSTRKPDDVGDVDRMNPQKRGGTSTGSTFCNFEIFFNSEIVPEKESEG